MSSPTHLRLAGPDTRRRAPRVVVIGAGLGGLAVALRLQGAGVRGHGARAARRARRARLAAARGRLHVGHRAVADHDAVGPRGGVRRRRPGPALGGPLRRLDPLYRIRWAGERRGTSTSTRTPSGCGSRSRASRPRGRRARRRLPRRAEADLRGGHPRRGTAGVRRSALVRGAAAADGAARRRRAAAPVRRTLVPPPAGARGVLVSLAVHRRRPVPRAGDLRRAGVPAGARRRLVLRRRRVLPRAGDGAAAGRALRDARGGDRDARATASAASDWRTGRESPQTS